MLSTNEKSLQSQVKDVEEMAHTLSEIKKEKRRDLINYMEGFRCGLESAKRAVVDSIEGMVIPAGHPAYDIIAKARMAEKQEKTDAEAKGA